MTFLGNYGLSLICAAMICGLMGGLVREGLFQKQLKLLCGLFLALTVVKPILQLELPEPDDLLGAIGAEADSAAARGTQLYRDSIRHGIQQELEAYIATRAEALGARLKVQVALSEESPPQLESVLLEGTVSADVKKDLQEMMEREMSLPKECQTWTGQR